MEQQFKKGFELCITKITAHYDNMNELEVCIALFILGIVSYIILQIVEYYKVNIDDYSHFYIFMGFMFVFYTFIAYKIESSF